MKGGIRTSGKRTPLAALIIEGSETVTKLIMRELLRGGDLLETARVADLEGLRAALRRRKWDVITSASSLPECSVEAALAAVREVQPETPFIVVSAAASEAQVVEARRLGARDYIAQERSRSAGAGRRPGAAREQPPRREAPRMRPFARGRPSTGFSSTRARCRRGSTT